jgi:hypothetical protein
VRDPALIEHLLYCCDLATMAYCPTKEAMCDAADIKVRALFVGVFFLGVWVRFFLCVPSLCLCYCGRLAGTSCPAPPPTPPT